MLTQVLLELPQVQQPLIDSFDQQLMSTNSEKEQRQIIKGLLANSGRHCIAMPSLCNRWAKKLIYIHVESIKSFNQTCFASVQLPHASE